MRRCLLALALSIGASVAAAQQDDPLRSADCTAALEALHEQEAALEAARQADAHGPPDRAARARLDTLRRRAAHACLGSRADRPAPSGRFGQPPASVPRAQVPPPSPAATPRARAPAQPAPRPAPLVTVTSCDSTGCWASDGSRLQRIGPNLAGPRGVCSTVAAVLICP